eukprot:TRINITY_DN48292_c0_g1_i1.p2 TRINITY_DN48292_c0_g1~~TRINITY_DN48292_c0_g1_i1.p2  ORF type:complete len:141 (-),score=25.65 TRINITY_DN48292_c0_g1_i1:45-413(-)
MASEPARDFSEIAADMPDEEEIVFDNAMREADADALSKLMQDTAFLGRCGQCLGTDKVAELQNIHGGLGPPSNVGKLVEAVVSKYGAPHLRPTEIDGRVDNDTACFSLLNLLRYAANEQKTE